MLWIIAQVCAGHDHTPTISGPLRASVGMQREDEAWHKGEASREWRANPEIMDFKVLRIIAELLEEQRHPLLLLLNFERDDAMWLMLGGRRSALLIRSERGLRGSND